MIGLKGIILFTIISLGINLFSCRTGGRCEEPITVNQGAVVITFRDAVTGQYLYLRNNSFYNIDSLEIFDPAAKELHLSNILNTEQTAPFAQYWNISFNIYNDTTDLASFSSELCKNYFIKYNSSETDTLKICFKSRRTECGSDFESLKVFYRDSLIGWTTGGATLGLTINKN